MKNKKRIYLASDSIRRKDLMRQIFGNRFSVLKHSHVEFASKKYTPKKLVKYHAIEKARSAVKKIKSGIVIGADTIVVCKGEILGKPETKKLAIKMLNKISGQNVLVMTGIVVINIVEAQHAVPPVSKKQISGVETTNVKIKKLSKYEIKKYVATKEPLDKAGAFGIQGKGAFLVESIKGDYFNVVGLPIYKLSVILNKLGVSIFNVGIKKSLRGVKRRSNPIL